ncbi:hypothetical protein GEZ65_04800 [Escherichia albertii]|uniref:Uncharacterized protein n=1 Tax=Escherichia albertii TaxID=208962 RepID=A0A7U8WVT6_ESCAL|nr:hypothetical protein [Escherichia albertii]EFX6076025.1 hypothetical protein [Shigella boydii]EEW0762566.1 hypothetical protein [Escherichia albertii]EEW0786945.1 hypothetical protein [Escherichia albertii]EEW3328831.1 hypothetical protein [Escherichia albertii]
MTIQKEYRPFLKYLPESKIVRNRHLFSANLFFITAHTADSFSFSQATIITKCNTVAVAKQWKYYMRKIPIQIHR